MRTEDGDGLVSGLETIKSVFCWTQLSFDMSRCRSIHFCKVDVTVCSNVDVTACSNEIWHITSTIPIEHILVVRNGSLVVLDGNDKKLRHLHVLSRVSHLHDVVLDVKRLTIHAWRVSMVDFWLFAVHGMDSVGSEVCLNGVHHGETIVDP